VIEMKIAGRTSSEWPGEFTSVRRKFSADVTMPLTAGRFTTVQ